MSFIWGRKGTQTVEGMGHKLRNTASTVCRPVLTAHGHPHLCRCLILLFSSCEKLLSRQKGRCLLRTSWLHCLAMSFIDVMLFYRGRLLWPFLWSMISLSNQIKICQRNTFEESHDSLFCMVKSVDLTCRSKSCPTAFQM